jgi:integrase
LNPGTPTGPAPQASEPKVPIPPLQKPRTDDELLAEFERFCLIDRRLEGRTVKEHLRIMRKLQASNTKLLQELSREDLRSYLASFSDASPYHYANILKALRVFFGAFLGMNIAQGFKFPEYPLVPHKVPTHDELQRFYRALRSPFKDQRYFPTSCYRACFLLWASSGRRRNEILELTLDDIDIEQKMLKANGGSSTKHTWVSFYNEEADQELRRYIRLSKISNGDKLFPSKTQIDRAFRQARDKSGADITPQVLREWFACEMGALNVPDRFVDAFCGRVPRSVLARHYTDYSPERLKAIYDKAGLKVLS